MIHLIRADLRRVLKRPTLYIFAGLMMIFIIFAGWSEDAMAQMSTEKNTTAYLVAIMASVPILITLYGDDFKSGSMIMVIGRGISRTKLLVSKLITSSILLLGYYLIAFGEYTIFHTYLIKANYSSQQTLLTILMIFLGWFRNVALFAFASILMYAFWSVAAGLISILALIAFLRILLMSLNKSGGFGVYDLTTDGLIDSAYKAMLSGDFPYQLIIVAVYFAVFIIAGSLFFKRKELDL